MQNREMIMHKVGKWFMIIGIAGLLSLLFIEWSRWNLVPLAEKINLVAVSENYHEFHTEFIEVGIATFSIFTLFFIILLIYSAISSFRDIDIIGVGQVIISVVIYMILLIVLLIIYSNPVLTTLAIVIGVGALVMNI